MTERGRQFKMSSNRRGRKNYLECFLVLKLRHLTLKHAEELLTFAAERKKTFR